MIANLLTNRGFFVYHGHKPLTKRSLLCSH